MNTARLVLAPLCVLYAAASLGACGGKIEDERTFGSPRVIAPPPTVPNDPGPPDSPLPPPDSPTPPTPPPSLDAGVPDDRLVAGSPQCTKRRPANGTSCRSVSGYVAKCEYESSNAEAGTCRWFCYCTESSPGSMSFAWTCSSDTCL